MIKLLLIFLLCLFPLTVSAVDWDLLDELCNNLSGWADWSSSPASVTIDPAGQFKFDTSGTLGKNAALFAELTPYPETYTIEIKLYHNALGTRGDTDHFYLYINESDEYVHIQFASDGLFLRSKDGGIVEIGTNLVKSNGSAEWQTWRFLVTTNGSSDGYADVYLNDSTHNWVKVGSAVPCGYSQPAADGEVLIYCRGVATANRITHMDYFKIATGLEPPPVTEIGQIF